MLITILIKAATHSYEYIRLSGTNAIQLIMSKHYISSTSFGYFHDQMSTRINILNVISQKTLCIKPPTNGSIINQNSNQAFDIESASLASQIIDHSQANYNLSLLLLCINQWYQLLSTNKEAQVFCNYCNFTVNPSDIILINKQEQEEAKKANNVSHKTKKLFHKIFHKVQHFFLLQQQQGSDKDEKFHQKNDFYLCNRLDIYSIEAVCLLWLGSLGCNTRVLCINILEAIRNLGLLIKKNKESSALFINLSSDNDQNKHDLTTTYGMSQFIPYNYQYLVDILEMNSLNHIQFNHGFNQGGYKSIQPVKTLQHTINTYIQKTAIHQRTNQRNNATAAYLKPNQAKHVSIEERQQSLSLWKLIAKTSSSDLSNSKLFHLDDENQIKKCYHSYWVWCWGYLLRTIISCIPLHEFKSKSGQNHLVKVLDKVTEPIKDFIKNEGSSTGVLSRYSSNYQYFMKKAKKEGKKI